MRPAAFEYHAPSTVAEAAQLLAQLDDPKVLAGGQSLVPIMALRLGVFGHLIDLGGIAELRGVGRDGHRVRIGAMTTQATFERDPAVASLAPLFAHATAHIGHFQIRNRGTVGGSLAHADPAAEYPAVALALDATFHVEGPHGIRQVTADQFFITTWTTALADTELLVAVDFAEWAPGSGFSVAEVARRHGDFALAGAVAALDLDGEAMIRRAAVAMFGVADTPRRAPEAEALLVGSRGHARFREAAAAACAGIDPPSDLHASAEYRRDVVPVVVHRALERAHADAAHRGAA